MSKITVRKATDADNKAIMKLAESCPQEGMITFLFKRTPQFNTITKLIDPESWHYLACDGDKIVGVVGVMHFQARVQDRICKVAYILDLLLDSQYRRGTVAFRLIKPVVEQLYQSDADMVLVNFLKDNPHPLVFAKGRAGFPAALPLGDNLFYSMLSLHRMKLSKQFDICQPTEQDIPEIAQVINHCGRRYKIAEVVTPELLQHYTKNITGLSLDNFLIARQAGKIKAVTAMWDEHFYKCYEVQKLTLGLTVVTNIVKLLSLVMKVPQPIRLNEPLSQLSLVLNAHDDCPAALDDLFRHVNNINRGSKYTLISLYAQQNDPVMQVVSRFKGMSVKSEMHAFARHAELLDQLKNDPSPVMFNLALLQ